MRCIVFIMAFTPLASPAVTIRSPIKAELVNGPDACSVKLSNETDLGIVAFVGYWKFTPNGESQPITATAIRQDFYGGSAQIEPHSSVVLAYGSMAQMADLEKDVEITIDSVLYTNGAVAGDNHFELDEYIAQKWAVRDHLVKGIRKLRTQDWKVPDYIHEHVAKFHPDGTQPTNSGFWRHQRVLYQGWGEFFKHQLQSGRLWESLEGMEAK